MALQILAKHRREPIGSERHWCGDPQRPGRFQALTVGLHLCIGDQLKNLPATPVVGLAKRGQSLPSRGPHQQLQTETLLQGAQVVARHGRGNAMRLRRRGEAAAVHHADEHLHAVQQIHSTLLVANQCRTTAFIAAR